MMTRSKIIRFFDKKPFLFQKRKMFHIIKKNIWIIASTITLKKKAYCRSTIKDNKNYIVTYVKQTRCFKIKS